MAADVQRELARLLRENLAHQHGCDTLLSSFICNRCSQSVRALLPTVQRLIADAEKRAAAGAANDSIADTVLALADDFLAAFPTADGGMDDAVDVDEAYDWLVAQAAAIRALDPAGAASGETT